MNELAALLAGIALAAACGFRVFVPLFAASLAANLGIDFGLIGDLTFAQMIGENHAWLGNDLITLALGVATVAEIGSYYIPWLDNLLDSLATPAAVVAGSFSMGILMPDLFGDGSFKWILSVIAGGGTAALVQAATVVTRGASTATTGGAGNPVVSTAELGGSVAVASAAILLPLVAGALVLVLIAVAVRRLVRSRRARAGA